MDTIKGLALVANLHWLSHHLRHVGLAMGQGVARVGRARSWRNIRHSTQSPWPFAMPSLILDVVRGRQGVG
jgi:hypothetical protein